MGENTKIEWAHHTFNAWIGCSKVSAGCVNCYAEELMANRYKRVQWGPGGTRSKTGAATWHDPIKWNKAAEAAGVRHRVFCASLADVFEDRPELLPWRAELFDLIRRTPHLDWLLLTKRPENIRSLIQAAILHFITRLDSAETEAWLDSWANGEAPANVWLGTSVENQEAADKRIPELVKAPAAVRFLSCEPLLGPVYLEKEWLRNVTPSGKYPFPSLAREHRTMLIDLVDWVIVGGESGKGARPMHPDWARGLRDQCQAAGVAFLFKQWGEWVKPEQMTGDCYANIDAGVNLASGHYEETFRVGKRAAGRILDGREWLEFPEVAHVRG